MFDLTYSFLIGVWTSESNFNAIGQEKKFLKLFVFKGDVQVVYYLPKEIRGANLGRVTPMVRSMQLERVLYPEIEQVLLRVQLRHPRGDKGIKSENNNKWREVFNQYLVGKGTALSINGGEY